MPKNLPGTAIPYTNTNIAAFSHIAPLLEATGGLSLSQVCSLTGNPPSTIQNWVKRGWIPNTTDKKYDESCVGSILIINALRDSLTLEQIHKLMHYVNASGNNRSDRIISNGELYNYLCEIIVSINIKMELNDSFISEQIEKTVKNYTEIKPDSKKRLARALNVMVYAYIASDMKKHTDLVFNELF